VVVSKVERNSEHSLTKDDGYEEHDELGTNKAHQKAVENEEYAHEFR